ncbi:DDB1- and CUL4-associated factor 17-like [Lytechinus variegatus]|uniref:DDB1- and CUL4-associated factor 17-like n=1 Tax=Lytechinus variegatus TaxID=7654 RepID=UPI001BB29463|nr:DDB1- and CUL4-associated factor 17-like [Lytechinus variegatus]
MKPLNNAVLQVRSKERRMQNLMRTNYRIVRNFICQDDVNFKQVWQMQSSSLVSYESNRLYADNYTRCFSWCGHNGKPSRLYKLPKVPAKEKVEDALVCEFHPEDANDDTRPHLITLTKDKWIRRRDLNTGRVLQSVYLHPRLNFNYLNWNAEGFSFIVKTTKSQTNQFMRAADVQSNILLTMAVFTIYPLELKACMEIDRRVFGSDTTGAHLDGGNILFTAHQRGLVRFYSLERILDEHPSELRLGDDFPNGDAEGCKIGGFPHGIPITLKLTEKPAVLFEVRCFEHDIKFGGFPWHFMISPPTQRGDPSEIMVYSLENKELAINGTLERNIVAADNGMPTSFFYYDGSDRIINTKMRSLSVLKFKQHEDGRSELVEDHVINPWPYRDDRKLERKMKEMGTSLSSSGRLIRHRQYGDFSYDEEASMYEAFSEEMINNFGCETDMDILAISMATRDFDTNSLIGHVTLHDCPTGHLLKTFRMPGEWDEYVEHHISLDLDTLVHSYKEGSGKWMCQVFRAQREHKESSKRRTGKRPHRSRKR